MLYYLPVVQDILSMLLSSSQHANIVLSIQHTKLIVGKGKQVPPEEVVGVREIYKKLETLNKSVRQGAEVRSVATTTKALKFSKPM